MALAPVHVMTYFASTNQNPPSKPVIHRV